MTVQPKRHLAAIMFTDVVGYTALMQDDEQDARITRDRHRQVVEGAVERHEGELLQYFGDGSLSVFLSAVNAVTAAVEIQRESRSYPKLPLRIGIHVGDITYDRQGAYGDAVNIAARIQDRCIPGGVLVSRKVYDEIRNQPRLSAVPMGMAELKNVRYPVPLYAIANEGIRVPSTEPGPAESQREPTEDRPSESGISATALDFLEEFRRRTVYREESGGVLPGSIPFVGRQRELESLRRRVDKAEKGRGGTVLLRGARGVGKTRLAQGVAEYAQERDWMVALGRAYPAERLMPYALFSDAFLPILRGLGRPAIAAITQGGEEEITYLLPALGRRRGAKSVSYADTAELQGRLFWTFTELLKGLASLQPLLVILEDLQWADESSLELLHFAARQTADAPILLVCPYSESERDGHPALRALEHSLSTINVSVTVSLDPLSEAETEEMVTKIFGTDDAAIHDFSSRLFQWTRGNPFFIEGTLRAVVEAGELHQRNGRWVGWESGSLKLPRSVKDAILVRVSRLTEKARTVATIASVIGTRVPHRFLARHGDTPEDELLQALDELREHQMLQESEVEHAIVYDFAHPLIRETIRDSLPLARARQLHGTVGEALERFYGPNAMDHADELAYHFDRARKWTYADKVIRYFAAAGKDALSRHANREAAFYLQEALNRIETSVASGKSLDPSVEGEDEIDQVVQALARARGRLGQYEACVELWERALTKAMATSDHVAEARIRRRIGLAMFWSDHLRDAERHFIAGIKAAKVAGDERALAGLKLAAGVCYQQAGRPTESREALEAALAIAEKRNDVPLQASVHRALALLYTWSGDLHAVRGHGDKALALADECGDQMVAFWSHWALAVVEGLTGDTREMARHVDRGDHMARGLHSPTFRLWNAELSIELAYATGNWAEGISTGERAIQLARSLQQRTLLPRLLVWLSLIYLGKGDLERAKSLIDEAWEVSGAGGDRQDRYVDVHTVVPAHIGRAAYYLAMEDWAEAVRVGSDGLAIADRSGYLVWGIHRLLPIIAEAHVQARNLDEARRVGDRLRRQASGMGHELGLAWAMACDAVVTWLAGDSKRGAAMLAEAAESLEAIPIVLDAARLRRQLAGRLAEVGDRKGALRELERVHEIFDRLGAVRELAKTTEMFQELNARPPSQHPEYPTG